MDPEPHRPEIGKQQRIQSGPFISRFARFVESCWILVGRYPERPNPMAQFDFGGRNEELTRDLESNSQHCLLELVIDADLVGHLSSPKAERGKM